MRSSSDRGRRPASGRSAARKPRISSCSRRSDSVASSLHELRSYQSLADPCTGAALRRGCFTFELSSATLPGGGSRRIERREMSTLSFQPEADRYYAQGYWRPGDLWGDFAARAHEQPDKVALMLDDRAHHLRRAAPRRRRAVRATGRGLGAARRRRHAARPPLDRGGGRAARLPAPRRRARAAAADVQRHPALGARRADRREGDRGLRRREGDRQVRAGGAARRAADHADAGRPSTS